MTQGNFIDWHVKISQISHIQTPWEAQLPVQAGAPTEGTGGGPSPAVPVSLCPSGSQRDQKQCWVPWVLHTAHFHALTPLQRFPGVQWEQGQRELLCHTPALQTTLSPPGCGVGQLPVSWGTPACSSPTQPTWHDSCQDGNTAKHALSHTHPARLTTFLQTKIWIRTVYRRSKPLARETWKCGAFRRAW